MTLVEQHKIWMRRERELTGRVDDICPCESCGCIGNNDCGHECLDRDCALDEEMICPCCNVVFSVPNTNMRLEERSAAE
jgi:hypothetical protein